MKNEWIWEATVLNPWLLLAALSAADDDAATLYSSRIDGLLDPFWRNV